MAEEYPVLIATLSVTGFLSLGLVGYCLARRHDRGALPLGVMSGGIFLWVLSDLVQILTATDTMAYYGLALRYAGVGVVAMGIALLVLEYTGREQYVRPATVALLSIHPLLTAGLLLSPSGHLLATATPNPSVPWGYDLVTGPLNPGHLAYAYGVIVGAVGLLFGTLVRSSAVYRRQLLVLFIAIVVPLTVSLLFNLGVFPFDPTPPTFAVTAFGLAYAVFGLRLMDAIPVARQTVLEELADSVVIVDDRNRLVDYNSQAQRTFGLEPADVGVELEAVISLPIEQIDDRADTDKAVSIEIVDDARVFDVTVSTVTDAEGTSLARAYVCRDVTESKRYERELERRERELQFLKTLQGRYLRHNVRNELNLIQGYVQRLRTVPPADQEPLIQTILETTDEMIQQSSKARVIENVVDGHRQVHVDVGAEFHDVISRMEAQFPAVSFDLQVVDPEPVFVVAVPQLGVAFENLLENAAKHNTASDPRVSVTVEVNDEGDTGVGADRIEPTRDVDLDGSTVVVRIRDNGPGIAAHEIAVLEERVETPLEHGSGFGLWVVDWIVEKSDGTVSFDGDDGTTVEIELRGGEPTGERSNSPPDPDPDPDPGSGSSERGSTATPRSGAGVDDESR